MNETAIGIHQLLKSLGQRLVLVESCTAGWVAAQFGVIPRVSESLCGSFVVYRTASKHHWLGIKQSILDDPAIGPVSERVTQELAQAALTQTVEATIAVAVTGHLGPNSPRPNDGTIFVSIARRLSTTTLRTYQTTTKKINLKSPEPVNTFDYQGREARQREAGCCVLDLLLQELQEA